MMSPRPRRSLLPVLCACALVALAACSPGTPPSPTQDVSAPGVFLAEDRGFWDGRASLGGIWVTHPSATEAERVLVSNGSNGRQTVAALYPGAPGETPPIRISSEAAQALGMSARAPATLRITALRRPSDLADAVPLEPVTSDAEPQAPAAAAPVLGDASASTLAPRQSLRPRVPVAIARPALQIGIFSTRDNARRAQTILRNAGVPARISTVTLRGQTYYSLGTDAIRTQAARDRLLTLARQAGFADAYATLP